MSEKYMTCEHSVGNVGGIIVYVKPTCPHYTKIRGELVSSKIRCRDCKDYRREKIE